MKKSKVLSILIAMLAVTNVFQSCNSDDDNGNTSYHYDIVTVKTTSNNSSWYLQSDDSVVLNPTNVLTSPYGTKEVRALVMFTPDNASGSTKKNPITILTLDSILTKKMAANLGTGNDAKYGNDPVEIVKSQMETCTEDGYLNLRFRAYFSNGRTHRVNLVSDSTENGKYVVYLYHDAAGTNATNGSVGDGIVAFRLDDVFNKPDSTIEIKLKWKSFTKQSSGDSIKTTTFKYIPRKDKDNIIPSE